MSGRKSREFYNRRVGAEMPEKDLGFWASAWTYLSTSPIVGAVLLSMGIAVLRMVYDGKRQWARLILESAMCGTLTVALWSALEVFGISDTASVFVGGLVGFMGVEKCREAAERWLGKKF